MVHAPPPLQVCLGVAVAEAGNAVQLATAHSLSGSVPIFTFAQVPVGEPSFGKVKLNKKKGTATLPVSVPGAGKVALKQTSTVTGATKTANAAGTVKLTVKARGKAKKALKKKGKLNVRASVTFTPTGGQPITETTKVKLVKK